ncbi:unnamed protein product [Amoebophrya sp. A25]|nr:unnamed protein product [Amoebophrya sp. A25]
MGGALRRPLRGWSRCCLGFRPFGGAVPRLGWFSFLSFCGLPLCYFYGTVGCGQ